MILNVSLSKLSTGWFDSNSGHSLAHQSFRAHKVSLLYKHYLASVHRSSTLFKDFLPQNILANQSQIHVVPPSWEGGMNVCGDGPGRMTKMAAMPMYGKNFKKSSREPKVL